MSPDSTDASMLAVAVPAPLRPTLLAVHSCTRQHANLLVQGQIVSSLVRGAHATVAAAAAVRPRPLWPMGFGGSGWARAGWVRPTGSAQSGRIGFFPKYFPVHK
jgi:hypothetical protein